MPRTPLMPPELLGRVFHRREAYSAGLTDDHLRARCWQRVFRHVFAPAGLVLSDGQRFEAVRLACPGHAVTTGITAAWLFGVWSPPPGAAVPLDLSVPIGSATFRDGGTRTRRIVVDEGDIGEYHGVRVTNPERSCFHLMSRSAPREAVVWADCFLHAGIVTQSGLRRYADERPHWPHVRKVRAAVRLARPRAASPMETRLRLVIIGGGHPEPPLINEPLFDAHGALLGTPDLGYLAPLFGIEFDGSYHWDGEVRAIDTARENRLLLGQVPLLRYVADDVYRRPDKIVADVGAMLRRAA